ncbi:sensor histidine kinase [Thermodesulfobacteriota bacterium]
MANGVMVTNRNQEIVLHNPALMRLLEIPKDIENPVSINSIINNRELLDSLKKIMTKGPEGHEFISQEIELENKTLRLFSAPATGPDHEIVGTVTVLENITAFKRLDDMKSDFVNMVAHELRSPLGSIRQQNSVIFEGLAGPLNDKQQDLMGKGIKKIDQLLELINELLDIAKIEAGKHVQHRVPLNLEQVLMDTVSLMECTTNAKGIELTCECIDLKPIQGDPKGIEEVFNNLITNAVNYSPEGGNVRVKAQGLGEYIEIRVEDNGVGIDPEEVPKIFDKFYRVKHPKTRQVVGTGLGLAIVNGIIEAHQGTIEVESIPDKGTTFRILLPVITADE